MSALLQKGQTWLTGQMEKADPTLVTYARGSLSVSTPGILGQQLLRVSDGLGNTKLVRADQDVTLTRPQDLPVAGITLPPKEGDQITVTTLDGLTAVYEVSPVGPEPHWRWSDPYHTAVRVHSKFLRSGGAPAGALLDEAGGALLDEAGGYLLQE